MAQPGLRYLVILSLCGYTLHARPHPHPAWLARAASSAYTCAPLYDALHSIALPRHYWSPSPFLGPSAVTLTWLARFERAADMCLPLPPHTHTRGEQVLLVSASLPCHTPYPGPYPAPPDWRVLPGRRTRRRRS